ncbi:hypothetical protein [Nocardioides dilutus]
MTRTLRSLAVALVGALLVLPFTSPAAADEPAAKCPFISVADSSKAARAVFTGQVTAVTKLEKPAGEPGAYYLQDVTVTRVYQGEIDTEAVQVRSEKIPKQCSLGELTVGTEYMFFAVSSGDPWIAESGGGTVPVDPEVVEKVERVLGEGRDPVPPAPESAEFTPVETGEPTTLSRAAAPGLALVLIGLLGLVVVRGLARRG